MEASLKLLERASCEQDPSALSIRLLPYPAAVIAATVRLDASAPLATSSMDSWRTAVMNYGLPEDEKRAHAGHPDDDPEYMEPSIGAAGLEWQRWPPPWLRVATTEWPVQGTPLPLWADDELAFPDVQHAHLDHNGAVNVTGDGAIALPALAVNADEHHEKHDTRNERAALKHSVRCAPWRVLHAEARDRPAHQRATARVITHSWRVLRGQRRTRGWGNEWGNEF